MNKVKMNKIQLEMKNILADVEYRSHLSRLKYAPENAATGRTGVYNVGDATSSSRDIAGKENIKVPPLKIQLRLVWGKFSI